MPTGLRIYVSCITALGLVSVVLAAFQWESESLPRFAGILLTALFAATLKVQLPGVRGTISVSFLFMLIGILDLGLAETLLMSVACGLVQLTWRSKTKPNPVQFAFNLSAMALSTMIAWYFYHAPGFATTLTPPLLLGLTACVYFIANTAPVAVVIGLAEGKSMVRVWQDCYFWTFPYYLVGAVVAGLISATTHMLGWQGALLILPVVYLIYRSYRLYLGRLEAEKEHARQLAERSEDLEREIAERGKTELTLRESQLRYRTLFESSPHPMWVYADETLAFLEVNDAAIQRYGYSRAEFLSMTIDQICHTRLGEDADSRSASARDAGVWRHRTKSGMLFEAEVRSHRITFSGQNARLVLADDITERRQAEKLRVDKDAAEAASRAKSEFLANMSHELRTPLNAILGYSELLQERTLDPHEDDEPDELIDDLAKIHKAGKHLLGLINDILDLSKIEAGRMDLCLEEFEVASVVQAAVQAVEPQIAKNGNSLVIHYGPEVTDMYSDMMKTQQVLVNLLSNAAKFTQNGTISLAIREDRSVDRSVIIFEVTDTGIGMTLDQLRTIGRPFTQADPSTTRRYGGTGLGLVISNQFCEMLGGYVTVDSEPNKGSTFTIHLPRRSDQAASGAEDPAADRVENASVPA